MSVCLFFIFKSIYFYLGDVIKSSKELIEHGNQLFGRTGACQLSESHNICIQDTTHTKAASALKSPITYSDPVKVGSQWLHCTVTKLMWRLLPDIFVLTDVKAVKIVRVVLLLLVALGLGESFYHFRFQLHSDVAWQH